MNRAESGRGDCAKDGWMVRHRRGDVVPTVEASMDELPGITGVKVGARGANGGATVFASHQDAVFAVGSDQVNRGRAESSGADPGPPRFVCRRPSSANHLFDQFVALVLLEAFV